MTISWFQNKVKSVTGDSGKSAPDQNTFGRELGLMAKMFGCRHKHLSRPFSHGKIGYRSCLDCGARRQFDPETIKTYGAFYFPPAADKILS